MASSNILESVYHGLVQGNLTHLGEAVAHATKALEQIFTNPSARSHNGITRETISDLPAALVDFFSNRTAFENTFIVLAVSAFFALIMSWTSRLGNLGRFSPFAREPPRGSHTISEDDYSYITADDLRRHQAESRDQHSYSGDSGEDLGPARDTDLLILRNKNKEYSVHFPAYSIAKGELTIGQVRDHAARKIGTSSVRRVKLIHKGKTLKDDTRTAKQEGLRTNSEVLCVVAESPSSPSESDDDEDADGVDSGAGDGEQTKKRRNRGKKTKRRNKREAASDEATASRQPQRLQPAAVPTTPLGKLDALFAQLETYIPDCKAFEASPPTDPAKREYEHKRLSETILTQVLLKTDAVETEGDAEARARRKELVRETQELLARLDAVMKK